MLQHLVHYFLHFIAIGFIAFLYDKKNWKKYWLLLLATMLVDLDHVFASPLFDPHRCGIGVHPLHSAYVIPFYLLGAVLFKNRIMKLVFIGLFFHMVTDSVDCLWMFSKCGNCELPSFLNRNTQL